MQKEEEKEEKKQSKRTFSSFLLVSFELIVFSYFHNYVQLSVYI